MPPRILLLVWLGFVLVPIVLAGCPGSNLGDDDDDGRLDPTPSCEQFLDCVADVDPNSLATQEIPCKAERIANRMNAGTLAILDEDADELANTEVAEVTLTASEPIQHESFVKIAEMGRLVLMRGPDIVAGGILP